MSGLGVPNPNPEPADVDQDAPFLPDASTASGLEGDGRVRTPETDAEAATDALRLELAFVIHEAGCQCRGHSLGWTIRDRDAQQLAQGVVEAGYRRVVDDDTTVERVARQMLAANGDHLVAWAECRVQVRERYRALARAAVRALREAGQ